MVKVSIHRSRIPPGQLSFQLCHSGGVSCLRPNLYPFQRNQKSHHVRTPHHVVLLFVWLRVRRWLAVRDMGLLQETRVCVRRRFQLQTGINESFDKIYGVVLSHDKLRTHYITLNAHYAHLYYV